MARSIVALSLAGILAASAAVFAEDKGPRPGGPERPNPGIEEPGENKRPKRRPHGDVPIPPEAREAFKQMSPEEQQRWFKRFRDWADLPPEKKKELSDRHESMRRRIREDIEEAITKSGLTLSEEEKKKFTERYFEGRRKIEEGLRREMEEKRRAQVQALIEQLKTEFTAKTETAQ
jgi:hypothetical protein